MEGNNMTLSFAALLERLTARADRGELTPAQRAVLIRVKQRAHGHRPVTRHNRPTFLYR